MMMKSLALVHIFLALAFQLSCTSDEQPAIVEALTNDPAPQAPHITDFSVDEKTGTVRFAMEVVYFEFDTYTLTDAGIQQLGALADYLNSHPLRSLAIDGHADSRGSNEYNLALAEGRAHAVKKFLVDTGVAVQRLRTTSFGEEQPAAEGSGENVWSKNRRCEFKLFDPTDTPMGERTARI